MIAEAWAYCHASKPTTLLITGVYLLIAADAVINIPWSRGASGLNIALVVGVICFMLVFVMCAASGYGSTAHYFSGVLELRELMHIILFMCAVIMLVARVPATLGRACAKPYLEKETIS